MRALKNLSLAAFLQLAALAAAVLPGDARAAQAADGGPIQQLRVYGMVERNRDAFDARFRDHALRIMRKHGFDVVAAWYASGRDDADGDAREFVYLLQWPDRDAMERGWKAFMADEEWKRIKRDSAREVQGPIMGEILQDKVLVPAAWSPRRSFAARGRPLP